MSRSRLLMACPNHWHSPFQVGSQQLARTFMRCGWDVAYISDPISPLHLLRWNAELRNRLALWWQGGITEQGGRLWAYVPAALVTPHSWPILRSRLVHRHWPSWTWPSVVKRVRERGFGTVDLLYIDSMHQACWMDAIRYRQLVFRLTDFSPHFASFTAAAQAQEKELARRADLVVYPSEELRGYVEALGAKRTLCLPNGVEFAHFAQRWPPPPEYARLSRPLAVYVGVILEWFHFDWLRRAAAALPAMSFVVIGPGTLARRELAGRANVHILGSRPYRDVPAYLQHADVGLMPFNVAAAPQTVGCLNPLKFYQYLASGLPVVSARWPALEKSRCPVVLCDTLEEFVSALQRVTERPPAREQQQAFAAQFDWKHRVQELLAALGLDNSERTCWRRTA